MGDWEEGIYLSIEEIDSKDWKLLHHHVHLSKLLLQWNCLHELESWVDGVRANCEEEGKEWSRVHGWLRKMNETQRWMKHIHLLTECYFLIFLFIICYFYNNDKKILKNHFGLKNWGGDILFPERIKIYIYMTDWLYY